MPLRMETLGKLFLSPQQETYDLLINKSLLCLKNLLGAGRAPFWTALLRVEAVPLEQSVVVSQIKIGKRSNFSRKF